MVESLHERMPRREGVVCVKDHYLYYHYEQQGTHDKGWGCAYRSLQTLISFFVLNHYYEMRIPTIPEVVPISAFHVDSRNVGGDERQAARVRAFP